tara:strand:+ start:1800 stop:2570 length:771 start_codon:yes stop_codon:yes gene_type:complete
MSSRLLDISQYLGGASNVKVINLFPRSQKAFTYNFDGDVSNYTFTADQQSLVLDSIAYDRVTGAPNFAESTITGYMNTVTSIDPSTYINEVSAATGLVTFTIPENRYTGPLLPNARQNPVMTVVSFEWATDDTPAQKDSHRWAIIETWEPGVTVGDPAVSNTYIQIGVGAISTFTSDESTDASRVAGTYTVTGLPVAGSDGAGHSFLVTVDGSGVTTINILARGTTFAAGDTIKILDNELGAGGAADITITVTAVA